MPLRDVEIETPHNHVFLGPAHDHNGRKTWAVIVLCGLTMVAEIVGGNIFGSIAVVADGLHMSTHAGALTLAAIAYSYARRHADDPAFAFGTGKLGDLVGFSSAVVLMVVAVLIAYEAIARLLSPTPIDFTEAILLAAGGLMVNLVSAWLLGRDPHHETLHNHAAGSAAHRDNNLRAVYIHIMTDAAVSVLAILGLTLGRMFGWVWMDPVMGLAGAVIIARWSYGLVRDTGAILLDTNPDLGLDKKIRRLIEANGDRVADLHLWRLGPGHLGLILAIRTDMPRSPDFYRRQLAQFDALSHLTIEVLGH